ncbi:MAG: delta-60 repeat domain-containing protein [Chloroflexi bacterium]|nr:delta-60 repeat domain-containing protein [Chloroflexota bacterium]
MGFRNFPFVPSAPTLKTISNGDGDCTVSWNASPGAASYTLQEDDNGVFSSPAYSGPATSKAISGRDVETYYYRVRASGAQGDSACSNVRAVVVTVPLPPCRQTGEWRGSTSQGRIISFYVENSPQRQIAPGSLKISPQTACGSAGGTAGLGYPITDDRFETDNIAGKARVAGKFPSPTTAKGTHAVLYHDPVQMLTCQTFGTWTAERIVGANGTVQALVVQPDGKILVGGGFTSLGGEPCNRIARLNAEGSLDAAFDPNADFTVNALALQPDGKILVGGDFGSVGGQAHHGVARLNTDGTPDDSFAPPSATGGADGHRKRATIWPT